MPMESLSGRKNNTPQRLGRGVHRLPKDVYMQCLKEKVRSEDIIRHRNRWASLGIPSTATTAALRALEEKKTKDQSMNRRGQTGVDVLTFMVIIFFIALLSIIAVTINSNMNDNIQLTDALPAESKTAAANADTNIPAGLDIAIVVAIAILYIGLYITTRNINTEPMFFWINLCLVTLVLGFSAILGNAFDATNIATLAVTRASLPATVFIGNHLLEFSIGAAAIVLIGLFSKPS